MRNRIGRIAAVIWVVTLLLFLAYEVLFQKSQSFIGYVTTYNSLSIVVLWDILVGIIAFIVMIVGSVTVAGDKHRKHTENENHDVLHKQQRLNPFAVILFVLLLVYAFQATRTGSLFLGIKTEITPTPVPINFSIPPNTPTPTSTPEPVIVRPIVTLDPDPPVLCRMSAECGGGTTPLRKSECDTSTCCQINGKWIFYKDKSQCLKDQGGNSESSNNTSKEFNCYIGDQVTIMTDENACINAMNAYWAAKGQTQNIVPIQTNPTNTPSQTTHTLQYNVDYYFCSTTRQNWCDNNTQESTSDEWKQNCNIQDNSFFCPNNNGTHKLAGQVPGLETLNPNECVCVLH